MQRHALARAGSPVAIALLAAGLCVAAVYAVPRRHDRPPRAEAGLRRLVEAQQARLGARLP
jgi:hypothetical protein